MAVGQHVRHRPGHPAGAGAVPRAQRAEARRSRPTACRSWPSGRCWPSSTRASSPKIILAALSVFFATLISMLVGLKSADATSLDLVHAYGGGSFTQLRKVRLQSSLPSLFAGLRVAAPAAVLGAVIGEYIGGEAGPGRVHDPLRADRSRWPAPGASPSPSPPLAGVGYALTALAERILVPWAKAGSIDERRHRRLQHGPAGGRPRARPPVPAGLGRGSGAGGQVAGERPDLRRSSGC